jgi:hypothetical protein
MRQLEKVLALAQANAYRAAGVTAVTLDFDSTYVFSRSRRRQGVDRTYKKGYALHLLLCFDAQTGAAVHGRLRRGKAGPSTGISSFVTEALRAVPEGLAVRARFDSGFYSGPPFRQMEAAWITYLCGVPFYPAIAEAAANIADEYWVSCTDRDGEVAEFGYRLRGGGPFRRYVVRRAEIPPGTQASLLSGGWRYWILVTQRPHHPGHRPGVGTSPEGDSGDRHGRTEIQLRSAPVAQTRLHGQLGLAAHGLSGPQRVLLGSAPRGPGRRPR